jgi:hypothetical protein
VTVPKCSGGDSTTEPDVRILQENVRGCDSGDAIDVQRE